MSAGIYALLVVVNEKGKAEGVDAASTQERNVMVALLAQVAVAAELLTIGALNLCSHCDDNCNNNYYNYNINAGRIRFAGVDIPG